MVLDMTPPKPTTQPSTELEKEVDQIFGTRGMMQEDLKKAILTLIEDEVTKARIDEVEKAVSNFRWGVGTDGLTDRLAELQGLSNKERTL